MIGNMAASGQRVLHVDPQAAGGKSEPLGLACAFETPKPTPCDIYPLTSPHLLILSNSANSCEPIGLFLFKPPCCLYLTIKQFSYYRIFISECQSFGETYKKNYQNLSVEWPMCMCVRSEKYRRVGLSGWSWRIFESSATKREILSWWTWSLGGSLRLS